MMEWIDVRLGDACTKIGSGATPRGGGSVYLDEGPIAFIRSQNVYNQGFSKDGMVYLDEKLAQGLANVQVEEQDVLLNITGDSVARACQVPTEVLPARVNQHVAIIRTNQEILWPTYLRYFLISPAMQAHMLGLAAVGATRNALTKGTIESFSIRCPKEVENQRSIAEVLSSLDEKIDLNHRISQTIEAIAQTIFKSWFVDFEPVKAKIAAKLEGCDPLRAAMSAISGKADAELDALPPEQYDQLAATAGLFPDEMDESELGAIPRGWEVSDMRSIAEVISKGTTPSKLDLANAEDKPSIPFIKVKDILGSGEVNRGGLELIAKSIHDSSLKRSILKEDDLLFSIAGTIGRTAFVDSDLHGANTNQAVAFIRLRNKRSHFPLCWLALRSYETQNFIASKVVQAVQANASLANIGDIPVVLSSDDVLGRFNLLVIPLIREYRARQSETRVLANARDILLPKLLSGELSVEALAEQAGIA